VAGASAAPGFEVRLVEHKVLVHLSEEEKNRNNKAWVLTPARRTTCPALAWRSRS
jgi:hypothetical protein